MIASPSTCERLNIRQLVNDIQGKWSGSTRRLRAEEGKRRCRELARLTGLRMLPHETRQWGRPLAGPSATAG